MSSVVEIPPKPGEVVRVRSRRYQVEDVEPVGSLIRCASTSFSQRTWTSSHLPRRLPDTRVNKGLIPWHWRGNHEGRDLRPRLDVRPGTREPASGSPALRVSSELAAEEYVDRGVSGAKDRRPALDQMIAESKRRRFDVVVCWHLRHGIVSGGRYALQ